MFKAMKLMIRQKQERGERILEATRELLAERGYAGMTVRELASRCGVSVPTLYNRFGGKDELIAQAVRTQFSSVLGSLEDASAKPGHPRLIALIERVADGVIELADYHRALLQAFSQVHETGAIHQNLAEELATAIAAHLVEMQSRRQLDDWVAIDVLSAQITTACIAATMAWSAGAISDDGLRPFITHSVGLILVASTRGASRKALLELVKQAQGEVAPELRSPAERGQTAKAATRS
jgi:AcrR family transcriptional regulator